MSVTETPELVPCAQTDPELTDKPAADPHVKQSSRSAAKTNFLSRSLSLDFRLGLGLFPGITPLSAVRRSAEIAPTAPSPAFSVSRQIPVSSRDSGPATPPSWDLRHCWVDRQIIALVLFFTRCRKKRNHAFCPISCTNLGRL